jgi:hypothetical protein
MKKIPVKIVETRDIHDNKKLGVMLDISYYHQNSSVNPDEKVKQFRELYLNTVQQAKKIYKQSKRKRGSNTDYYRQFSKLLRDFNERTENEFLVLGYRQALARDFGLTDSYVGVLLDFIKFFKEAEVLPTIPMSIYFELTIKKRKLERLGIFEREKTQLLENARIGKIPDHKGYRQYLTKLLQDPTYSRHSY